MNIPYTVEQRPETGVYNGKLGMWLFIASEAMLFAGLFSALILLRTAAPDWPTGREALGITGAIINTIVLFASSATLTFALTAAKKDHIPRARKLLWATVALSVVFFLVKSYEYNDKFSHELYPSISNFYGMYYILTGIHFLHVLGGLIAVAWHAGPGVAIRKNHPDQYTHRIEVTAHYWYFIDIVWLLILGALYLL